MIGDDDPLFDMLRDERISDLGHMLRQEEVNKRRHEISQDVENTIAFVRRTLIPRIVNVTLQSSPRWASFPQQEVYIVMPKGWEGGNIPACCPYCQQPITYPISAEFDSRMTPDEELKNDDGKDKFIDTEDTVKNQKMFYCQPCQAEFIIRGYVMVSRKKKGGWSGLTFPSPTHLEL